MQKSACCTEISTKVIGLLLCSPYLSLDIKPTSAGLLVHSMYVVSTF